ncbi:GntR family transcriptional regulator [Marinivivus vitaminiproducens]|uniref:GntR family transcriptional regulator n=1 Tax=Marinivivus vitaminiproducens TaxID=3035935 RepID=UPI00279FFB9D|nr:GntR family transcriptional regulator [Geminicoccaceae bacterium SCSIO 64248]
MSQPSGLPLAEQAFRRLREDIQDGRLTPGTRMVELDIAKRLAMSRTPIREALRRLEETGLITQAPHRGLVVASLDMQAINELYEMREVLEGTAAELAARHASAMDIAVLERMVEKRPDPGTRPSLLADRNRAFHERIYHASHNRYLLRALSGLTDALVLLGPTTFQAPGRGGTAHAEHLEIVRAIARRDAVAAGERARAHIRAAYFVRVSMAGTDLQAPVASGRHSD